MTTRIPRSLHQPVETEVGHHGDGDEVDIQVEREDGEDLVAVDRVAVTVDREHPVAVTVERDAEVVSPARTVSCSSARSVAPQPSLMFSPFGSSPMAVTSAPSRSKASGAIPA